MIANWMSRQGVLKDNYNYFYQISYSSAYYNNSNSRSERRCIPINQRISILIALAIIKKIMFYWFCESRSPSYMPGY